MARSWPTATPASRSAPTRSTSRSTRTSSTRSAPSERSAWCRTPGASSRPADGSSAPPRLPIGEIVFKKKQRTATVVGLDLDPSHIAAAEVHANGSVAVTRGAIAPLRPGVLRDGEASDPSALAAALKEMFEANDLPRRVRLGIANQRIVVRSLDLPVIEDPK